MEWSFNLFCYTKDLGIYLDPCLSFKHHIQYLINNVRSKTFFTRRFLWNISSTHVLYTLFFAMFISIITYGISIYSSASPSYLNKLISSYNTAIKIIQQISTRNGDINTSAIQFCNSFPTFTSICRNQDLKLLTKFIQGLLPVNTIYFNVPQVNTRKLDLLYIRKHRLHKTTNSFFYRACKYYNDWYSKSTVT